MDNWISQLNDWNLILILIGLISLLALSIFVERLVKLQRKEIDSRSFIFSLRQTLKQGDVMMGLEVCEKHKGSLSEIVKAALLRYHLSKQAIENAMEMTGRLEIADLEKKRQGPLHACLSCPTHWPFGNRSWLYRCFRGDAPIGVDGYLHLKTGICLGVCPRDNSCRTECCDSLHHRLQLLSGPD